MLFRVNDLTTCIMPQNLAEPLLSVSNVPYTFHIMLVLSLNCLGVGGIPRNTLDLLDSRIKEQLVI